MDDLFQRYTNFYRQDSQGRIFETRTRLVRVESGVIHRIPSDLATLAGQGPVAVFFDDNTRQVAGDDLLAALDRAGIASRAFLLQATPGTATLICSDATIQVAQEALGSEPFTHAIAVGSGTINDIVKMASFNRDLDYSILATAPSMNGFTSSIASVLSEGVKTTRACRAALCAFADPAIMAAAPYRMIASGLGDLYSKPVSNADWRLSHRLIDTPHSSIVMEFVDAAGDLLEGVAPRLAQRDVDAVARLTGSIMLSGLGMQAAGNKAPASGGEHLISHYLDMSGFAFGLPMDFHGCQVAVGTCTTLALHELLQDLDLAGIDVSARVEAHPEWEAWEPVVLERFGAIDRAVLRHASKLYPTRLQVRERLERLRAGWSDILADVRGSLRPLNDLRSELEDAGCPTRFHELGVSEERAFQAILWSKDIRARYTILHLASELGVLEDFAHEQLRTNF